MTPATNKANENDCRRKNSPPKSCQQRLLRKSVYTALGQNFTYQHKEAKGSGHPSTLKLRKHVWKTQPQNYHYITEGTILPSVWVTASVTCKLDIYN